MVGGFSLEHTIHRGTAEWQRRHTKRLTNIGAGEQGRTVENCNKMHSSNSYIPCKHNRLFFGKPVPRGEGAVDPRYGMCIFHPNSVKDNNFSLLAALASGSSSRCESGAVGYPLGVWREIFRSHDVVPQQQTIIIHQVSKREKRSYQTVGCW